MFVKDFLDDNVFQLLKNHLHYWGRQYIEMKFDSEVLILLASSKDSKYWNFALVNIKVFNSQK